MLKPMAAIALINLKPIRIHLLAAQVAVEAAVLAPVELAAVQAVEAEAEVAVQAESVGSSADWAISAKFLAILEIF